MAEFTEHELREIERRDLPSDEDEMREAYGPLDPKHPDFWENVDWLRDSTREGK